jgi:hypothetical protein
MSTEQQPNISAQTPNSNTPAEIQYTNVADITLERSPQMFATSYLVIELLCDALNMRLQTMYELLGIDIIRSQRCVWELDNPQTHYVCELYIRENKYEHKSMAQINRLFLSISDGHRDALNICLTQRIHDLRTFYRAFIHNYGYLFQTQISSAVAKNNDIIDHLQELKVDRDLNLYIIPHGRAIHINIMRLTGLIEPTPVPVAADVQREPTSMPKSKSKSPKKT